jgi:hypothetical protein
MGLSVSRRLLDSPDDNDDSRHDASGVFYMIQAYKVVPTPAMSVMLFSTVLGKVTKAHMHNATWHPSSFPTKTSAMEHTRTQY